MAFVLPVHVDVMQDPISHVVVYMALFNPEHHWLSDVLYPHKTLYIADFEFLSHLLQQEDARVEESSCEQFLLWP